MTFSGFVCLVEGATRLVAVVFCLRVGLQLSLCRDTSVSLGIFSDAVVDVCEVVHRWIAGRCRE